MTSEPRPLEPMVGNLWVPVWAVRPGSYSILGKVAAAMPLWLLLHSRNGDYWHPSYHTRDQLAATLGTSRATITRRLRMLKNVDLLFEVKRGRERRTRQHRPPARWALDPFKADLWTEKVVESLQRIAEEDGHDGRWFERAKTSLEAFERRSRILGAKIGADMPFVPRPRKRKARKRSGARIVAGVKIEPWAQNEPRGEVFTRGR